MWNEPKSVEAVRQYVRILSGLAFFAVLLYLLIANRIDIQAVMGIIAALAGMQNFGQVFINRQQAKARAAQIRQMDRGWDGDLTR